MSSPFAEIPPAVWLAQNRSGFAVADAFPVSAGHSLVVPRRLIATWWEASRDERHELLDLVDEVKALLDERHGPDGFDHDFLRAYRQAWKPRAGEVVDLGVATEAPVQPVEPWPVQRDALDALEATRAEGHTAGLVVMATGLGKTAS